MKLYNKMSELVKSKSDLINKCVFWYALIVMVYQAIYLVMPIRWCIYRFHLNPFSYALAMIGLLFAIVDFLFTGYWKKNKASYLLLGIIAILTVSAVINYQYNFVQSVKSVIWQTVQMLVLFPLCTRFSKDKVIILFRRFFTAVCCVYIPGIIISLYQFLEGKRYAIIVDKVSTRQGYSEGRLFGVFSSPHFSSVCMLILGVLAIYFFTKTTKKSLRAMYVIFAVLFFTYVTAAGARSVQVGLACALAVSAFLFVRNRMQNKKIKAKRLISAVIAVAMIGVCFLSFSVCKTVLNWEKIGYMSITREIEYDENGNPIFPDDDDEDDPNELEKEGLQRDDVNLSNISNNRFTIWTNYLETLVKSPVSIAVGMSPSGYMEKIIENSPDLYIVQYIESHYPDMFAKDRIYDTHNAYLGALVMSGVVGLILLFTFLILGFIRIVKHIHANRTVSAEFILGFALLVFILAASFFDSDLFYRCTSTSVNFWVLAGFTLTLAGDVSKKEKSR